MSAGSPALPAVRRSRLVACCALLVGLALVQDPGLLVPDTKFDLVAAPADWLARALHVWDAQGGFGQVQNQAHGYLWPMGPFFWLLHTIGLPGWVVQRLWQALVLCVAMAGTAKLARAFGVRSDLACLVAGFAYALSPRLLTSLGPISIEVWPSALAPWVLLPLVAGAERGSPRRSAALSGLAVAMVGGVNAAASFAVVPLAVVWILTRTPGPRRRALMLWWPVFAALATLWWIVPLLVMGAYSPPFLDFTETSAITTFPTTLFDTLRGTSHWVPYVDAGSRAGNELIRTSWLAVNTAVVVVVGLVGLLDRRTPHRTFLVLGLLSGVVLVTAGHHGAVQGWFAGDVAAQLDGVLAPLRNVHKFDPVLRVPLVLGLAVVLDRAVAAWRRADRERLNAGILVGAVVLGVVGAATPAVAGRAEAGGAMLGVPDYWRQAADDVAARSRGGTTLLVPGSAFAEYLWGDPQDEPMQWLAGSRWGVRNAGILAEPGQIRMLEGLERRFAEGHGSTGLTAALRRAGVEQLVVRNDLRASDDVPDPALVHQAIAQSPGLERVATFGPDVGGSAWEDDGGRRTVRDGGRQASYPAVEVFTVPGVDDAVTTTDPSLVAAGPEDLADLVDAGVLGPAPVRLAADADPADDAVRPRRVVLTDGLRARERQFARMHDGSSATLTPGEVRRTSGPVRDLTLGANDDDRWSTTARLEGAATLSASSSASDADALGGSDRGRLPYAAVDDDATTAWASGPADPAPWWRVGLDGAQRVTRVGITAAADAGTQGLRVVTAAGASAAVELSPGGSRQVTVPADGTTTWVRVEAVDPAPGTVLALADVEVPGVSVRRVLDLPALPTSWGSPDVVALRADRDGRTGCVVVAGTARCASGTARTGEDGTTLRRSFALPGDRAYDVSVTAVPRPGAALDALLLRGQAASAQVSSTAVADPRAGATAAVDGDGTTAWLAATDDERPTVSLSWLGVRTVRGIDLDLADGTAARRPTEVVLTFWNGAASTQRRVDLDDDGSARFAPVRAERVEVGVVAAEDDVSDLRRGGTFADVPVGIGEVTLTGVPYLPATLPTAAVALPCGSGPDVIVGERRLRTAVTASPARLATGAAVPATVCGEATVDLSRGRTDVTAEPTDAFVPGTVVLTATDDPGEPAVRGADLAADGSVRRTLTGSADGETAVLRESANRGWAAEQGGTTLDPVVLDGWQQAFVSAGDDPVEVRFAPDTAYRAGLLAGLLLVLVLLGALVRMRGTDDADPVGDRALPPFLGVPVALAVAALSAGTLGLVLGVVVVVGTLAARRVPRLEEPLPWLLAAPVLVAGLAYALRPWASPDGWAGNLAWVGYLSLVPLVALPVAALASRSGKVRFSRIAGRSTKR
ncbi:alpha-(1-_3)-arabinofuranosyltransferase domain-containing protein [Nocardioides sp. LML1-1-1.1]|uniref:alpha-(1->3)-arabinofuranosyltransferase domain-containing protein n=1 Tax=Nocardioides sp. LML1-1-1.1 TaxID=3135248 RepID=UPI00341C7F12